jgi:hypothetical protein
VGPGLSHPFTGMGLGLDVLGWLFGAIFFPLAHLPRPFVGLLGGFWACGLLFTFGWPFWLMSVFGALVPGLLCYGPQGGCGGPFV